MKEITAEALKSIEAMAKLEMPFSILSKNQQEWLEREGLEYFRREKPFLYPLVEKLVRNRDKAFPEKGTIRRLAEEAFKRVGWEGEKMLEAYSWVEKIIRWKRDPFNVHSEEMKKFARVLMEVVEKRYKKDPESYKYLYKAVSEWVRWNRRMDMYRRGCL